MNESPPHFNSGTTPALASAFASLADSVGVVDCVSLLAAIVRQSFVAVVVFIRLQGIHRLDAGRL